jgi:hypothetical protein
MKPFFLSATLFLLGFPMCMLAQSGHVGIGTLTPNARLQINHKSSAQTPAMIIFDSVGGEGATIGLRRSGNIKNLNITLDNTGLKFFPTQLDSTDASTPLLFQGIIGNNNFGLGTETPLARLQVNHKAKGESPSFLILDSIGGIGPNISLRRIGSVNYFDMLMDEKGMKFDWIGSNYDRATPVLAFTPYRKIGVGTDEPSARFQINHKANDSTPSLRLVDSVGGTGPSFDFTINKLGSGFYDDSLLWFRQHVIPGATPAESRFAISTGIARAADPLKAYKLENVIVSSYYSGHVGFGSSDLLPARVNIEHRSTVQSPLLQLVDSTEGNGNMIQFRKQGTTEGISITTNLTGANPNWSVRRIDQTTPLLYQGLLNNRVGIGTANPQATLDVNGSLRIIGVLIAMNTAGQPGQVLTSNGPNEPATWKEVNLNNDTKHPDTIPFHAYSNQIENVTPGNTGKILGIGGLERFDPGNNYDPQTATYTCHEGTYHFNARVSTVVGSIDSEPHTLTVAIEIYEADNTTLAETFEDILFLANNLASNTKITADVNTIVQVKDNQKVRVRVKHNRMVNMNVKLEEFSGKM